MHRGVRPILQAARHTLDRRQVRMMLAVAYAASTALGVAACHSPQSSSSVPKASPDVITAEEISRVSVQNAYEAVQKLRPAMFRPRQPATAIAQAKGEVLVYVDNNRFGDAESLRLISVSSIALVRYFSASEAQQKWGSGHPGGVIEVLTHD